MACRFVRNCPPKLWGYKIGVFMADTIVKTVDSMSMAAWGQPNRINNLRVFGLRGGCVLLRAHGRVEPVQPGDVSTRYQMAVGVDGGLDRAVPHLLLHVGIVSVLWRNARRRTNQLSTTDSAMNHLLRASLAS
jgi:hypothetical protein